MGDEVRLGTRGRYLHLPCETDAPLTAVELRARGCEPKVLHLRLARNEVDSWLRLPLDERFEGQSLELSAEAGMLRGAFRADAPDEADFDEPLRPQIHLTEPTGGIPRLDGLTRHEGRWYLRYEADPLATEECNPAVPRVLSSRDLLHWRKEQSDAMQSGKQRYHTPEPAADQTPLWTGDVASETCCEDESGRVHVLALSARSHIEGLPTGRVFSLPVILANGALRPDPAVENLRVWHRAWRLEPLERQFRFDMRFGVGPAEWPGISILPATGGSNDLTADACEVDVEIIVGMEPEISFDLSGTVWRWDALNQELTCGAYALPLTPVDGRLRLRMFADRPVRELFTQDGRAMLVIAPDGIGKTVHQIRNEEIENIQNPNFTLRYYADPYFAIQAPGRTARIVELNVYALRPVLWRVESRRLLRDAAPGRALYETPSYTVYEHCVEDRVYGDPPAWALNGGRTVLSPVRAVEEFCWRQTPWGDMTRIVDRGERWDAGDPGSYPVLDSGIPTLDAAYRLSVDIMRRNVSEEFALPGQKGLMNAALFQGPGEGFGIWKRDACHSALRIQNLLAPEDIRKSLRYITKYGFDNGSDAAAMLAIAAWDHYVATGDRAILAETAAAVERNADFADSLFDERAGLVRAVHSVAQDAFPEPENGGFCLSPQVYYAHMYRCAADICEAIGRAEDRRDMWRRRGNAMLEAVRARSWNADRRCYCSGPAGSDAFRDGHWEATGAEAALWPRFGIADRAQSQAFLKTIEANPRALSDFGLDWYPFAEGKNHFWRACWVSWSLGVAVAAARAGRSDLTGRLIWQQVRNVLLNKTFHEVIDNDTGRAWRWPGLPWHAAAFLGFLVYGAFGIDYGEEGLSFLPAPPPQMERMALKGLRYRESVLDVELCGRGSAYQVLLDGEAVRSPIGIGLKGRHEVQLMPEGGDAS